MNRYLKPCAILVGDEIGQLKRIDLKKNESRMIELVPDEFKHPSKGIVSINPLNKLHSTSNDQYFLVSRKDHEIFIYDTLSDETRAIKYINDNKSCLVGAQCVDDKNIVIGFQDGSIKRINVENDLCFVRYKPNYKAINLLGIDKNAEDFAPEECPSRKRKRIDTSCSLKASKTANEISNEKQNILTIQQPNWNVENTYLTCFEINKDKLAIGGFNSELKVFDLKTGQNVFNAKPVNTDWLGCRHDIWISGVEWIEPYDNNVDPHLIVTCSRSEPFVRIYDIKRQRRPIMTINLKHLNNDNNESNPLSFTTLCSLPSLAHYGQASSSLIVGTTRGRMLAVDLRIKGCSSKVLGSFKGFSGGSIRDIKSVQDSQVSHKIFSCSIDRFVRIHKMTKTSRILEKKIYVRTRPTCLYPLVSYSNGRELKVSNRDDHDDDYDDDDDKFD